jgi:hypothetical protein
MARKPVHHLLSSGLIPTITKLRFIHPIGRELVGLRNAHVTYRVGSQRSSELRRSVNIPVGISVRATRGAPSITRSSLTLKVLSGSEGNYRETRPNNRLVERGSGVCEDHSSLHESAMMVHKFDGAIYVSLHVAHLIWRPR